MTTMKPQLTISLLASDRPTELRRCLESLRPITEALSCELILIDTSKNPMVNALLKEYTAQVYEFEWCRDFAKARNEGMKRAQGEWFMYLDDDEWFVESDVLIEFFRSGEYKEYGYANYQIRNFLDAKYENYTDAWVSRMVKLDEDTHFVSKIHEYFTPTKGKVKNLQAMVYHSGYIYETPEAEQAHFERNCSLLLEMIKEEPQNLRWRTQLAQEYCGKGEWERLYKLCEECLKLLLPVNEAAINKHIGTFYIGMSIALLNQKRYEESIEICQKGLSDKRAEVLLQAYLHLKLGESYFRLECWEAALREIAVYLKMLQTIDSECEEILEQKQALLVGDVLSENCQKIAYSILIAANLQKGSIVELREYYSKLGWNQSVIFGFEDIEKIFVKAMWTFDYEPIFVQIIVNAFKNQKWRELFVQAILKTAETEELTSTFQKYLLKFVQAMSRVSVGVQEGDMLGYYDTLAQYVQATCQWYDYIQEQGLLELFGEENPGYIQAALYISDYFEEEGKDVVQALFYLKEAVETLPDFAEGIGSYLHSYSELERQRAEKQKKEMEVLRIQVISQVKAMLAAGQTAEANQIIEQLQMMFPGDLEIEGLRK